MTPSCCRFAVIRGRWMLYDSLYILQACLTCCYQSLGRLLSHRSTHRESKPHCTHNNNLNNRPLRLDFNHKGLILSINKRYRVAAHVEHPKSFPSEVHFGEDVVYVGCRLLPRCLSSSFAVFVRLCVSTCGADVWRDGNSRKLMSKILCGRAAFGLHIETDSYSTESETASPSLDRKQSKADGTSVRFVYDGVCSGFTAVIKSTRNAGHKPFCFCNLLYF